MDGKVTIYGLCDENGGIRYVGQTRMELARRLAGHANEARRGTSAKDQWFRGCLASGQRPTIRTLVVAEEEEANQREGEWITQLRGQGQADLNDRSRSRAHGVRRRKGPDLSWSHFASFPARWRPRVKELARKNGVPTSVMLRLLVRAGLEVVESADGARGCERRR